MTSPLLQCVGEEFDVGDDNVLHLKLGGNPAHAAVPATGNGMRLDPVLGMWVPAEHHTTQVSTDRDDSPAAVVNPGGTRKSGRLETTVTNPSATRTMLVNFSIGVTAVFNISPATDDDPYTGWSLLLGYDVDAVAGAAVPTNEVVTRRDQGIGTEAGIKDHVEVTDQTVLDPGAHVVIRAQTGFTVFEKGYVRYLHTYLWIRGIGVTQ